MNIVFLGAFLHQTNIRKPRLQNKIANANLNGLYQNYEYVFLCKGFIVIRQQLPANRDSVNTKYQIGYFRAHNVEYVLPKYKTNNCNKLKTKNINIFTANVNFTISVVSHEMQSIV